MGLMRRAGLVAASILLFVVGNVAQSEARETPNGTTTPDRLGGVIPQHPKSHILSDWHSLLGS
jgi:hypothetical protein